MISWPSSLKTLTSPSVLKFTFHLEFWFASSEILSVFSSVLLSSSEVSVDNSSSWLADVLSAEDSSEDSEALSEELSAASSLFDLFSPEFSSSPPEFVFSEVSAECVSDDASLLCSVSFSDARTVSPSLPTVVAINTKASKNAHNLCMPFVFFIWFSPLCSDHLSLVLFIRFISILQSVMCFFWLSSGSATLFRCPESICRNVFIRLTWLYNQHRNTKRYIFY